MAAFINRHTPSRNIQPALTFSPLAQILAGTTPRAARAAATLDADDWTLQQLGTRSKDEGTAAAMTHQIRQGHSIEDVKEKNRTRSTTFNCAGVEKTSCCNRNVTVESFIKIEPTATSHNLCSGTFSAFFPLLSGFQQGSLMPGSNLQLPHKQSSLLSQSISARIAKQRPAKFL